jgi:antitoxin (DNA-binding transcriptional repressor) of toxin-antitoxin stability system
MNWSVGEAAMGKMVSATEFKAKSLALIDEMERSGEPLTVTRRGKPSVTLKAERAEKPKRRIEDILGCMKGTVSWDPEVDLIASVLNDNWEEQWQASWDEQMGDKQP